MWTRFEVPDERQRWDAPLFHVTEAEEAGIYEATRPGSDGTTATHNALFEAIASALYAGPSLRPTAAVLPTKTAAPTYLHELDRRTNDVVTHLTAAMASVLIGDAVRIPGAAEPLPLLRKMAPLELKRRKRAFDKLATTDPIAVEAIVPRFVAYLSAALRDGGDA